MRNFIKIFIILIVSTVVMYLSYRIIRTVRKNTHIAQNIATLPELNFVTIENRPFNKQDIQDTLGKIIIELFSPDCEHCQYMAKTLVTNKDKLRDTEIIMVTPFGDSASVSEFVKKYQLDSLPKIHVLLDPKFDFQKIFGSSLVPFFFVYKNNKLVKTIKGETKIENLLD